MSDFNDLPVHYSLPQVAKYLFGDEGEVRAVKRIIASGELKAFQLGIHKRVFKEELDRFMRGKACKPTEQASSSSSAAESAGSSISAGTNPDRQRALALARRISKPRGMRCTSTTSSPENLRN